MNFNFPQNIQNGSFTFEPYEFMVPQQRQLKRRIRKPVNRFKDSKVNDGFNTSFSKNNEINIKKELDLKEITKSLDTSDSLTSLSNDMYSMFENGQFTDVTINCDGKSFKVHKSIICARSSVFTAMFTNDMREKKDNVIIIDDMEYETLHKFLYFIYSGQISDLEVPIACNLMYAADKYEIESLKKMCHSYLTSNISNENAFQILQCGDLYHGPLKSIALSYVARNFASLRTAEAWKNMQTHLALEVYAVVVDGLL